MQLEQHVPKNWDVSDRPFHNELAIAAYEESFAHRCLTERYRASELRRLQEVFSKVYIEDSKTTGFQRLVDTFDLCNPLEAAKIRQAVYRDIPSQAGAVACLKSIERYCR